MEADGKWKDLEIHAAPDPFKNNFDQHKITKRKRRQREVIDWMLLKRGIGNGEWGMGNGEWGMGNGEWGMGNGE